jgi:hypothetical protein
VSDLEKKISALYHIPVENLLILLRHEHIFNQSTRTELYNMDWRKPKTIEDASRLDHGVMLYIEEGNPKGKLDEFKWNIEFTKD